jgi:hypothetical protein
LHAEFQDDGPEENRIITADNQQPQSSKKVRTTNPNAMFDA